MDGDIIMGLALTETQNKVCSVLLHMGDLKRSEIVRITKIARTTIFDNLDRLRRLGVVEKYSRNRSHKKRGRPPVYWSLNKKKVKIK
jgi:predicted ArsR family transcriptional regulator